MLSVVSNEMTGIIIRAKVPMPILLRAYYEFYLDPFYDGIIVILFNWTSIIYAVINSIVKFLLTV